MANIDEECFNSVQAPASAHAIYTIPDTAEHCDLCVSLLQPPSRIPLDRCYGFDYQDRHCLHCFCRPNGLPLMFETERRAVPVDQPPSTSSHVLKSGKQSTFPVDLIRLGWAKGLRVLSIVTKYVWMFVHNHQLKKKQPTNDSCSLCKALSATDSNQTEVEKLVALAAKNSIFRFESH